MKRIVSIAIILTGTAYCSPEKRYWTLIGFGIPLVQCQLVENKTRNCRYVSNSDHPLDGVMEAVHRGLGEHKP